MTGVRVKVQVRISVNIAKGNPAICIVDVFTVVLNSSISRVRVTTYGYC